MKSFLPGLAVGLVIGGLAGAFLGPMVSNPPEPVARPTGGPPIIIQQPPGTIDERAPRKPEGEEQKKSDTAPSDAGQPPTPPEAPKTPASEPAPPK